jgi:hypothetical protein
MTPQHQPTVDDAAPAPPPPPVAVGARWGVIEQVYHYTADGGQPLVVTSRYNRRVPDVQPYQRRVDVGPEWQPLDCGWVTTPGMLVLANEGPRWTAVPTEQQAAASKISILELGMEYSTDGPVSLLVFARVRSGESCRWEPNPGVRLLVRCAAGPARATLTALPG